MSADPTPLPRPRAAEPAPAVPSALPAGTRFGEFEIVRVLGLGGFGIVYLAHDHSLEREVALKEYMPALLALRGAGSTITVRAGSAAETYATGLRSFLNEARLLARFDHPSLVKVYRVWEDNGTAYMVMPHLPGRTLRDARRAMAAPPDEAWIRAVLDPLLDALERLHREGVFHRDIAPDNIVLPPDGPPVLLDFGAARRVIGDRPQALTAIVKPSYAPIEQYAEVAALRQGPWTDLYALGAVLHELLFGAPPAPSTARAVQPDAEPITQRRVPGVSPRFVAAVAWMLGVHPAERPQSVAALRDALDGRAPIPSTPRPGAHGPDAGVPQPTVPAPVAARRAAGPVRSRRGLIAAGVLGATLVGAAWLWQFAGANGGGRPVAPARAAAGSAPGTLGVAPAPAAFAPIAAAPPASAPPPGSADVVEAGRSVQTQVPPQVAETSFDSAARAGRTRPTLAGTAPQGRAPRRDTIQPATARAACADRHFIGFALCVERQCERRRFRNSADCTRLREDRQRRIAP